MCKKQMNLLRMKCNQRKTSYRANRFLTKDTLNTESEHNYEQTRQTGKNINITQRILQKCFNGGRGRSPIGFATDWSERICSC